MLLRTLTGAAIGGISQDPFDNPFSAIVGAGIGATAGFYSSYNSFKTPLSTTSKIQYNASLTSGNSIAQDQLSSARRRLQKLSAIPRRLERIDKYLSGNISKERRRALRRSQVELTQIQHAFSENIRSLSQARNIALNTFNPDNLLGMLDSNASLISLVNDAARAGKSRLGVADFANQVVNKQTIRTSILNTMDSTSSTNALVKHFKMLGHTDENALRKAKNISQALSGLDYSLNDSSLTVKINGQIIDIPLTAHNNDFRFSKIEDTFYVSKSFNPFGRLLSEGQMFDYGELSDIYGRDPKQAIFSRLDPEEMLGFYRMNNSQEDALRMTSAFARKHIEYMQSEAHLGSKTIAELTKIDLNEISDYAKRMSALSIGVMESLSFNKKDKTYTIKTLDTLGSVEGGNVHSSEYSRFFSTMSNLFGYDPFEGQSVNTIGRYTNKTLLDSFGNAYGLFPSADRGYDSQTSRAYAKNGKGFYNLNRLDVDEDMAQWISRNIGGTLSIDDGAGIIAQSTMTGLQESQYQNFEIHRSPTGKFVAHEMILAALESDDKNRILKGFAIKPDTVLGFDVSGNPIKIGNVFTDGEIQDAFVSGDKLHLRIKSTFSGKDQSWVKLFGTSSKAGYSVAEAGTMNRILSMYAFKYLKNNPEELKRISLATSMEQNILGSKKNINISESRIMHGLQFMANGQYSPGSVEKNMIIRESVFKHLGLNNVDLISGASETGNKFTSKIAYGSDSALQAARQDLLKQIASSGITEETKSNAIFAKYMNILEDSNSSRLDIAKASVFMTAQTDFKGNADVLNTLYGIAKQNQSGIDEVNELYKSGAKLFYEDRNKAFALLDSAINKIITNPASLLISKTRAQIDLGIGLHGIGNVGSMSWIERTQLKSYGFTEELLGKMSSLNHDALYELELMKSLAANGEQLTDIEKASKGQMILKLFEQDPSVRGGLFNSIYGKSGDYISHGLTLPDGYSGRIRSVPISSIATNRTNIFEQEVGDILSSVDKSRRDIIAMDIEYASADLKKRAALKTRYIALLDDMEKKMTILTKGEGNIIKEASKRAMPGSGIMRARSISGPFADYINEINANGFKQSSVVMSHDTVRDLAKRAGVDVEFRSVKDQKFQKAFVKGTENEFRLMLSREPAQGAYSTIFSDVYAGSGLDFYDVGVANTERNIFKSGMFLDYDYDILKAASVNFANKEDRDFISKLMNAQASNFDENEQLMNSLSRKGNKATNVMHGSFNNINEFIQHQMYSAMKSKQRKILAPHATDIAMNMTNALDAHLRGAGLDEAQLMRKSILGRTLIHNMTESLLKSAHRSSSDLARTGAISEIELMKTAYEKLAKGDSSSFEADFRRAATSLFSTSMEGKTKELYDESMSDVIRAAKTQAYEMEFKGGRISDFRQVKSLDGLLNAIGKFQAASELPVELGTEDVIAEGLHKTKSLYQNIRKNIMANKKPLGYGALGLAATALFIGSEKPEMTKETLPYSTSDGILQPMQSQNAHVFKKKQYGQTANIRATHHEKGSTSSRIRRDTFGQNHGGRTNITIRDKRESSY